MSSSLIFKGSVCAVVIAGVKKNQGAELEELDLIFCTSTLHRIWLPEIGYFSAKNLINHCVLQFLIFPKQICKKMAATRRLQKELGDIRKAGVKAFRDIQVDEANMLTWQGLIVPDNPPYNKGAFRIEINFPAEYPFKPPKITFKTKIYHPNIDEKGQVCLPIIFAENWKPATKTDQVIQALVALVNDPEPEHPLRAELAEEFLKDKKKFVKNAEEFTKKHSEKRPSLSD